MAKRWLILGAGGHGRSVCDAIAASGDHVVGFLDDALPAGTLVNGTPVMAVLSLAWDLNRLFAASDESLRQTWQQLLEQVAAPLVVVLYPRAIVSVTAQLGLSLLCSPVPLSTTMPFAAPTANSVSTLTWLVSFALLRSLAWPHVQCSTAAKPVSRWYCLPVRLIPEKA